MTSVTLHDAMGILQKIPKVKDKLSQAIVEFFLSHPFEWQEFQAIMQKIQTNGYCVCGNFAYDTEQKYGEYNLCEFCRQPKREGILLVPDMPMLNKMKDIVGESFWFHLIDMMDEQSQVDSVKRLVLNLRHKLQFQPKLYLISALGTDGLSVSVVRTIEQTVADEYPAGEVRVVTPQLGLPVDMAISQIPDATLGYVFLNIKSQIGK